MRNEDIKRLTARIETLEKTKANTSDVLQAAFVAMGYVVFVILGVILVIDMTVGIGV